MHRAVDEQRCEDARDPERESDVELLAPFGFCHVTHLRRGFSHREDLFVKKAQYGLGSQSRYTREGDPTRVWSRLLYEDRAEQD
jgi:hypothetical protein